MSDTTNEYMDMVINRNANEPEFHQAVQEVLESIVPALDRRPELRSAKIVERMIEPERVIIFRVPWLDDRNEVQVNRGYRVEFNSVEQNLSDEQYGKLTEFNIEPRMQVTDSVNNIRGTAVAQEDGSVIVE